MTRILVIDDRLDNLTSVRAILKSYEPDYNVITAQSGQEGIDLARKHRPDTILLDIQMPEIDGYEVCRILRLDERTKQTPVIFLTAKRTTLEDRVKGLELGGDAYLFKPIDPAELIANIHVMLRIKRAEDENLKQYETMVSNSSDMQALLTSNLKYKMVNSTLASAFGKSTQEFIGLSPPEIVGIGSSETTYMQKCLKGKSVSREINFEFPNLGLQTMDVQYSPTYDSRGEIGGVLVTARNITNRKEIENKLANANASLQEAQKIAMMGSWEMDVSTKKISWSDQIYEILEVNKNEEPSFELYYSRVHPDDLAKVQERGSRVLKENRAGHLQYRLLLPSGAEKVIATEGHQVYENDDLVKLIGIVQDVTEQVLVNKLVKKQQSLLSEAQQIAKLGAFSFNVKTFKQEWTEETFRIMEVDTEGEAPEVPEGVNFIAQEYRAAADSALNDAIVKGKPYDQIWEVLTAKGNRKWVRAIGHANYLDGEVETISGSFQDITSEKEAERKIQEALLEAEQANEVKDQFVANISHEIRTPLNSILGFSDLFKLRYSDLIRKKDKIIFDYIGEASTRLMKTVDSILNISMLSAGSISVHKEAFKLDYLVQLSVNNFKIAAEKKHLVIKISNTGKTKEVFVDRNTITSAIENIIENAIKYTEEGHIDLSLKMVRGRTTLSISDTGIGISEEYQERIFEPYTQESEGFTKDFQGAGLGLALTKKYLDLNNVDLKLKSKKGVGTTFTLTFPKYERNTRERK